MKIHVAAVVTPAEVRMLTAAPSTASLERRLAAYVRRNAAQLLWPSKAARVLRLLEQDRSDEAISLYFSTVGDRWGPELLHVESLDFDTDPDELFAATSGTS